METEICPAKYQDWDVLALCSNFINFYTDNILGLNEQQNSLMMMKRIQISDTKLLVQEIIKFREAVNIISHE